MPTPVKRTFLPLQSDCRFFSHALTKLSVSLHMCAKYSDSPSKVPWLKMLWSYRFSSSALDTLLAREYMTLHWIKVLFPLVCQLSKQTVRSVVQDLALQKYIRYRKSYISSTFHNYWILLNYRTGTSRLPVFYIHKYFSKKKDSSVKREIFRNFSKHKVFFISMLNKPI